MRAPKAKPKAKKAKPARLQLAPPPGAARPRRPSDKYQRILDAAALIFAQKGFHAARVCDVAAEAAVADGTIYLYFRNKEELLMTVIQTAFAAFMTRARLELESIPSPADKLRRLAYLHLDALGSNRELAVVFQMELRQSARFLAPFSHQQMIEYFQLVRSAIREGQEQGLFRSGLRDKIAANCFFGALDEMVTSWVLDETHYQLSDVAEIVADIILLGLEG